MQIRVGSGEEIDIDADRVVIGRDEACDIRLDDTKVSRQHAEIVRNGNGYEVRDLGSSNGTYLGSMRLTAPQGLKDGDVVRIGAHRLTVSQANGQITELEPRGATMRSRTRLSGATTMFRDLSRQMRLVAIGCGAVAVIAIVVAVLALTGAFSKDEPTVADATRIVAPSTVQVLGDEGTGTGWVYDAARGLIVTNEHVVDANKHLAVAFGGHTQPAAIVGVAYCDDLAMLQVARPTGMRSIQMLASQSLLTQGQPVATVGYPGTFSKRAHLVTDAGVVSVTRTTGDSPDFTANDFAHAYLNLVQTDAAINHGNSGGPMVDLQGRLVGVSTLAGGAIEGPLADVTDGIKDQQNYAIGIDRVHQLMPTLRAGQSRGFMGAFLDFEPGHYPKVTGVVPTMSAARAGISPGDAIVGLDGRDIKNDISEAGWCKRVWNRTGGLDTSLMVRHGGALKPERITVRF